MKKLIVFLAVVFTVPVFAQINPNEFPKIGFTDIYWERLHQLYNSPNYSHADSSWYYPRLKALGLTHVVTNGDAVPLNTSYNNSIKILDANFSATYYSSPYYYSHGFGNYINHLAYEVGGGAISRINNSGEGIGFGNNGNGTDPTTARESWWIFPYDSNTIGFPAYHILGENVIVHAAIVGTHNPGVMLHAEFDPTHQQNISNLKLRINAKIDGASGSDSVAKVTIYEYIPASGVSPKISNNMPLNNPPQSGLSKNTSTTLTDTSYYITANNFGGNNYITLTSPPDFWKTVDTSILCVTIEWLGTRNLYIDKISIADQYYDDLFIANNLAATTAITSDLISAFSYVKSKSLWCHLYNDEPKPLMNRAEGEVSRIAEQAQVLGTGKYINGATGGLTNDNLLIVNNERRLPYVLYDNYTIAAGTDTASSGSHSIQNAYDVLINNDWGSPPGYDVHRYAGLRQAIATAQNYTPTDPSDDVPMYNTMQVCADREFTKGVVTKWPLRAPTPNEILAEGNLSMCYGANGLMYYTICTNTPNSTGSGYAVYGLFDQQGILPYNDRVIPVTGLIQDPAGHQVTNERFAAVKKLNDYIDKIKGDLLSTTWDTAFSIHQGQPTGKFVTNVSTNVSGETKYVEVGIFKNYSTNADYFMLVNRRTLSTESRNITATFNNTVFWNVADVASGKQWIIGANGSFTDSFSPGEGKLYKISPMTYNWNGNITVMNTVSVPSGTTLTVMPGAVVKFSSGVSLTVNGTISAQGTSTTPIQFTSATGTTPGSWNSVTVQNGNSIFKYCTFQYASIGLYLFNATAGNRTDVENCTFQGNTKGIYVFHSNAIVKSCDIMNNTYGIYCCTTSDVKLVGNTIHNNSSDGVHSFSGNVVQLYGNAIDSNSTYGVYTASSDIVRLGWPYTWEGYNTVCYNDSTEVYASSGSPIVTMVTASVHDTTGLEVYNTSGNPQIYATHCYWGANNRTLFYGSINLNDPQYSIPSWDAQPRTAGSPLGKVSAPVVPDGIPWFYDPRIPDAEKVARCKNIIANNPSTEEAKTTLIWLYTILRTDYTDNQLGQKSNFFSYLQGLKNSYPATPLGKQALRYMIIWKILEQSDAAVVNLSQGALTVLTGEEKKWVMADLAHAYARLGQLQNAKGILQGIRDQFGEDKALIALIDQDLSMDAGMLAKGVWTPEVDNKSLEQELELPTEFDLVQNYPNPFNPSTVISYQLSAVSNVSLKVYDMLGRQVAILVDGQKDAGYHSATFDGSGLSSGVYFVRFTAQPADGSTLFTKTIKMLLTK
jgi:hypothetical protein